MYAESNKKSFIPIFKLEGSQTAVFSSDLKMTLIMVISHLIRYKLNGTWYLIETYSKYRIKCGKSNKKSCVPIFKLEEFQKVVIPRDPIKT